MDVVNLTNTTIFKFYSKDKKWTEKGHGDITFSLKGDELMVGIGKQSFFVKGELRRKGPNVFVIRVCGIEASSDERDMILAVKFGKQREAKLLFAMLPDKMLDKKLLKLSRMSQKSVTPIPTWFASLEGSKRKSIHNHIKNANPKYLNDGSLHMQLVKIYGLSQRQIEEVIDIFRPCSTANKISSKPISSIGLSAEKGNMSAEPKKEGSNLQISRLTEQNLIIYNRIKPPLKGDFKTIVNMWLQQSVP